ncbi:hypothetical protein [Longispora fulva]|uniref:Uncharacterized protein n=1 Tax=Longispora fulva TaxID=619741 RepID=A0A8J7GFM2_9ACTN|nr:hypothetical protein [Longispora fulva]MBG6135667.1 hypothetical protein [Longispora fulva]
MTTRAGHIYQSEQDWGQNFQVLGFTVAASAALITTGVGLGATRCAGSSCSVWCTW